MAVSWQTLLKLEVFGSVDRPACNSFPILIRRKKKNSIIFFFANFLFSANTQEREKITT
jgi:hypothetical protein